ncbi:MAG: hypothetical protein HYT70_00610 [Candidatus Aenigmarchaeota archaeon]|nr:hypothetical protein [Candidatus Aenigmarchaeota archaeon]
MPAISRDYEKFLQEEQLARKLSIYERLCEISEFLPVFLPKGLESKYSEAIEFSHLKITPKGAITLSIVATLMIFAASLTLLISLDSFSLSTTILSLTIASMTFYFLASYPIRYATSFRINASSEMVLAAIYMSISMHLSANLENSVKFASRNLKGALAKDLRELLWSVYTRKYDRIEDALEVFIKKWERENKEFATALYLIKNSSAESQLKRERFLDEAVSVILEGTKERMKGYAREMKEPVTILNALGILLPIIGLVFFPVVSIFLPEIVKPVLLVIGYDVFLPLIVFFLMSSYLERRPYSFHQPDLRKHPQFAVDKFYEKPYIIPVLVSLPLIGFGISKLIGAKEIFSFELMVYSMLVTLGIFAGIISYSYLSVRRKLKIRQEIADIEGEFAEALFQLGSLMMRGIPLETALKRSKEQTKNMKISDFFDKILYNIKTFGMTFEGAVFDKQYGAIRYYPSTLIEAIMNVVVETSQKGMQSASKSMVIISKYLKDMREVNEDLKNMMEDVTSTMNTQAIVLAPLSAGVVVTLAAIMTRLLVSLGESIKNIYGSLGSALGPASDIGSGIFQSIFNIGSILPVHAFQLIVGVYLVEIATLIAVSSSTITNGDESLLKRLNVAKILLYSAIVYFISLLVTYFVFTSVISIERLTLQ